MRLGPRQPLRPGGFVTIGLPPEITLTNSWVDLGDSRASTEPRRSMRRRLRSSECGDHASYSPDLLRAGEVRQREEHRAYSVPRQLPVAVHMVGDRRGVTALRVVGGRLPPAQPFHERGHLIAIAAHDRDIEDRHLTITHRRYRPAHRIEIR